MRTTVHRAALALVACTALLAACSGGGGEAPASSGNDTPAQSEGDELPRGFVGADDAGGEAQPGGTLTYTLNVEADSLDPAGEFGAGSAGGSELTAIYDLLVRYDYAAGEYVPQLAESVEPNEDFSVWTVGLRDGVTFTDGTPLDAEAVKFSVERYLATSGGWSSLLGDALESVTVADPSTVVFTLTRPWADFEFMLAQAPGNIVSPTAVAQYGDEFLRNPVGAGPFVLDHWAPGEELVLTPNPDYWGGKPYLDELRFTSAQTPQALADLMTSGGTDVTQIRDPHVIRTLLGQEYGGFVDITNTGNILYINSAAGHPGEDVRVRQAIAAAIDPEAINQRAYDGEGLAGTEVFQDGSRWANDVGGPAYDPDEAKRLLEEAKADGYDGSIEVTTGPTEPEAALTIQAMLNAVGFQAEVAQVRTGQDLISKVLVDRDFDVSVYGASATDDPGDIFTRYYDRIGREGNFLGYDSPEMTQTLLDFAASGDEAEKKELAAQLQEIWNETMPFLPFSAAPVFLTWQDTVHGVQPSTQFQLLFDKAWVEQ